MRFAFKDARTIPRLTALNSIAGEALAAEVAGREGGGGTSASSTPLLRDRVVFLDGLMAPTFALADASKDDAHLAQDPVQRHFAQMILEALRASALGRG